MLLHSSQETDPTLYSCHRTGWNIVTSHINNCWPSSHIEFPSLSITRRDIGSNRQGERLLINIIWDSNAGVSFLIKYTSTYGIIADRYSPGRRTRIGFDTLTVLTSYRGHLIAPGVKL